MNRWIMTLAAMALTAAVVARAQTPGTATPIEKPMLYVVGTSHLDTQWRWDIRTTINEYVPATFADNYKLLDLYPGYVFSFEGSFRYQLLREYRPDLYARLGPYIRSGQWRVTGSWVDAVDVNLPSFESLVRHTLYGNGFYKREFGVKSHDIYLPDCFGFGFALPSIAAHCGLKSFSTQKLTWGSWIGTPFDIGVWEGVDGSSLVAAVNPGEYVSKIEGDLTRDTLWLARAEAQRKSSGLGAALRYFGTGDTGGAPDSNSVAQLARSLDSDGPLAVKSIAPGDIVDVVAQADRTRLPRYKGELVMTRHGVGCYTSQAAMKRWNRRNELLADAAERALVIGSLFGGIQYPRAALEETWTRFLWHQFHDDLTGTSIPEAYQFSWNDEVLTQNRFAGMLEHAIEAISPALDTRAKGAPVVVYNPVGFAREDLVEAAVRFPAGAPVAVRVYDSQGAEVPAQVLGRSGDTVHVLFPARVPSVGLAVYDVRPASAPLPASGASATPTTLENRRYRVTLNAVGDVASIFDKRYERELLAAPIQWQLLFDKPNAWPSWEIDYDEVQAPPRAVVGGEPQVQVMENGPVRASVRITRRHGQSEFRTTISLADGDAGDMVRFDAEIDWAEKETLLKAAFQLACPNEHITYDIGLGTIERGLNHPKLYEVPGQQWADMTSTTGDYGVAILNDSRYGWDHPDSHTVRLSLIHTPGVYDSWSWVGDQRSQDIGTHHVAFAVIGHRGDWREGAVAAQAAAFNQPLIAFQTESHGGADSPFALMQVETYSSDGRVLSGPGAVHLNCVKAAEQSDEIVIRLRETAGLAAPDVRVRCAFPIVAAREVNGAEEPLGEAVVREGVLTTSLGAYQPRAFAIRIAAPKSLTVAPPRCRPIELPFDLDGISLDTDRRDGDFDNGRTLAGELLPDTVLDHDIPFVTGPKSAGAFNVVVCRGQELALPAGDYNRLHLLLTSVGGPAEARFRIDGRDTSFWVQDYADYIGQWDSRLVAGRLVEEPGLIAPAYILRQPVGWYGTHRHSARGDNEAYQFTYLYHARLPLPRGAQRITLPDNPRLRLFAMTAAGAAYDDIRPAAPLYDVANATIARIAAPRTAFVDSLVVSLSSPSPAIELRYTLDGSDPSESSPLYAGPITLTATATVKARAFSDQADDAHVAQATYALLGFEEPVTVTKTALGLACDYFEGTWDSLPDFATLKPARQTVLDSVSLPPFAREEDFGLIARGYITVPVDGLYDFYLSSDDGSDLALADTVLIDNDGLHGMGEVGGAIGLRAGTYPLLVRMFQKKGGRGLVLLVEGPGMHRQEVPAAWFSHSPDGKHKRK